MASWGWTYFITLQWRSTLIKERYAFGGLLQHTGEIKENQLRFPL